MHFPKNFTLKLSIGFGPEKEIHLDSEEPLTLIPWRVLLAQSIKNKMNYSVVAVYNHLQDSCQKLQKKQLARQALWKEILKKTPEAATLSIKELQENVCKERFLKKSWHIYDFEAFQLYERVNPDFHKKIGTAIEEYQVFTFPLNLPDDCYHRTFMATDRAEIFQLSDELFKNEDLVLFDQTKPDEPPR
jgi:hypothetical protein